MSASKYRGLARVFVTCTTDHRHAAFSDDSVCSFVLSELAAKTAGRIEITAYCLMPDHGHLLLTGLHQGSDIPDAIRQWKQATGFWYARLRGRRLWQRKYWDYVLRDSDDSIAIARYVVSDPVRSDLTTQLDSYQWWGSDRWTRQFLIRSLALEGPGFSRRTSPLVGAAHAVNQNNTQQITAPTTVIDSPHANS